MAPLTIQVRIDPVTSINAFYGPVSLHSAIMGSFIALFALKTPEATFPVSNFSQFVLLCFFFVCESVLVCHQSDDSREDALAKCGRQKPSAVQKAAEQQVTSLFSRYAVG